MFLGILLSVLCVFVWRVEFLNGTIARNSHVIICDKALFRVSVGEMNDASGISFLKR